MPGRPSRPHKRPRTYREAETLKALSQSVADLDLEAAAGFKHFSDLPLSQKTLQGLKDAKFTTMTPIQAAALPVALKGKDILGAARTGSGKTLAFLIPMLEVLVRKRWGANDGLGALILSPTRELAMQIFQVLTSIGKSHQFSAGLIIGGKSVKEEADRLSRMNILIATPGRLLQHMDQTYGFQPENLQILILDEADRILDLGFSKTMSAIVDNLPPTRQTLLFSATQTASVSDLALLSLRNPEYIAAQEGIVPSKKKATDGNSPTQQLEHYYAVTTIDQKLNVLYGFIRTHLKCKAIVFFASGKQVRHAFTAFSRMRPGISLIHLHGKMKQTTRMATYERFNKTTQAVLFATDIAARGLDFPAVDWVVQVDCPEDAATYIHRVGRTARYQSKGSSLLLLTPSEEPGMVAALKDKSMDPLVDATKIQLNKIKIKESQAPDISNQLQNLAFQDPDIKYAAQRAYISHVKSLHLQSNKRVFRVKKYDLSAYAQSLGLLGIPDVAVDDEDEDRTDKVKNQSDKLRAVLAEGDELDEDSQDRTKNQRKSKIERMFERKNQGVLSEHYTKMISSTTPFGVDNDDSGADEPLLEIKRQDHELAEDEAPTFTELSKRKDKIGRSKKLTAKTRGAGHKLTFDEDGQAHEAYEMQPVDTFEKIAQQAGEEYKAAEKSKLAAADADDRTVAREKRRERKRKRKTRAQSQNEKAEEGDAEGGMEVELDSAEDEQDEYVEPDWDAILRKQDAEHAVDSGTLEADEAMALRLLAT